ncbi:MAG: hypothetical protein WCC57_17565 [Paracoccaceae bacterium]
MAPKRRLARSLHTIAYLAMLLPFLGLATIARGVMPGVAPDGSMVLVLCSEDGPVEAVLDLATGEVTQKAPPPKDGRCDWAIAHGDVALQSPLGLPMMVANSGPIRQVTAQILWRPGFDPRGIYARGPPTLL